MPANKPKPDPVEIDDDFKAAMLQRDTHLEVFENYDLTAEAIAIDTKWRRGQIKDRAIGKDVKEPEKASLREESRKEDKFLSDLIITKTEKIDHTVTLEDKLRAIHDKREKD
jgi:hypothetical protein